MDVSESNNVKIYNLSVGRSLPEWLSDRKRRALLKKNAAIKRRIELIQDFDMPDISNRIQVTKDGQSVIATGIYKPRVKCFDVNNLSLKFDRCFDAEVVAFEIFSQDYSKMGFLQCDRYLEFHIASGKLERFRIPKYGRDLKFHPPSADLFVVGRSPDIFRFNLELGRFMPPWTSSAVAINKCTVNPAHYLFSCGTEEGRIESWDHRVKERIGVLDCAFSCLYKKVDLPRLPSITALKYNGPVELAVGTATGQVLLYDLRSDKPFAFRDHSNNLPIKDVEFHHEEKLIYSLDSSVLKIWDKNQDKMYTSIAATAPFNNLCVVPKTGLLFLANESPKIQTYFIPSLGPAPAWASFLDSLTEELEESQAENIYDDYKFVTAEELADLGLQHLVGTKLLRAYMHGYFLDIRLYKKAKALADPLEFNEYRKRKIRETIKKSGEARVQVNKLPSVNKDLALKIMEDASNAKRKKTETTVLEDDRFKAIFQNPEFEIDKNSETYRLLNPVLSKAKTRDAKKKAPKVDEEELEGKNSSEESSDDFDEDTSDDDHTWSKEVKKEYKLIQKEHRIKREKELEEQNLQQPDKAEERLRGGFKRSHDFKRKMNRSLGERVNRRK